jgi:hypothetical protein
MKIFLYLLSAITSFVIGYCCFVIIIGGLIALFSFDFSPMLYGFETIFKSIDLNVSFCNYFIQVFSRVMAVIVAICSVILFDLSNN